MRSKKNTHNKKKLAPKGVKRNQVTGKASSNQGPKSQAHFNKKLMVCGIHACDEVLRANPDNVNKIYILADQDIEQKLLSFKHINKRFSFNVVEKQSSFFKSLETQGHQGIAILKKETFAFDLDEVRGDSNFKLLMLDGIEDPHNLGAIFRTAWLMGFRAIIAPENGAAGLSPTVYKIASGGCEHVSYLSVPSLKNYMQELKDKGFWIFGLSEKSNLDIKNNNHSYEKLALVMGSEGKGIRPTIQKNCDGLFSLDQASDSPGACYNVSVAAALAMREFNN